MKYLSFVVVMAVLLSPNLSHAQNVTKTTVDKTVVNQKGIEKDVYKETLYIDYGSLDTNTMRKLVKFQKTDKQGREVMVRRRVDKHLLDGNQIMKTYHNRATKMLDEDTKQVVVREENKNGNKVKRKITSYLNGTGDGMDKYVETTIDKKNGDQVVINKEVSGEFNTISRKVYRNGILIREVNKVDHVTLVDGIRTTRELEKTIANYDKETGVLKNEHVCTDGAVRGCALKTVTRDVAALRAARQAARLIPEKLDATNARETKNGFKRVENYSL